MILDKNGDVDWTETAKEAANAWVEAEDAWVHTEPETERLMVQAIATEVRLLYALLRMRATSADGFPECIDQHLECWLEHLRGSGAIPGEWPSLIDQPGT